MSLIHEALKKAEQEGQPSSKAEANLTNPILKAKKPPSRPIILFIVLGVSLAFLIYMRFFHKSPAVPAPTPLQAIDTLNLEQNPAALKRIATQLFTEKKYEASLATWERLTLLLPTEPEVYNNMGLVLKKLKRREEAFQAYTKALALKENSPETLNNLGALYLAEGQREEAKKKFQEASDLAPEYPDPYFHLGLIAEQEGNARLAIQQYETFLKKSPSVDENLKARLEKKMEHLSK